ncbi:HVA22-like protein i [Linum perenne]
MLGSFLTRGLVLVFGYAYPAYECYKTVELNKPEIEQLRFWCQYWILVAMLTGSTYVYESFFRPYIAKHENEIDRNLLELRTRAGDMAIIYWQRAASYAQTRVFDILQFVAAQSTPSPRATQQQQGPRARQVPNPPNHQPSNARNRQPAASKPEMEEPPSPTSSTSSSQHQVEAADEVSSVTKNPPRASNATKAPNTPKRSLSVPSVPPSPPAQNKAEVLQIEASPSSNDNTTNPAPTDTIMEEAIRVTRGRLRKTRSGTK